MKIAIVRGWAGVVQQKSRWNLDRQIADMERSIANTERNLEARRTALRNLIVSRDAIPNCEEPGQ